MEVYEPFLLCGVYGLLLWLLQVIGGELMARLFFKAEFRQNMPWWGVTTTTNYFSQVNGSGCLFLGISGLMALRWPLEQQRDLAAAASVPFLLWSVQNAVCVLRPGSFFSPTMWGPVWGCLVCGVWYLLFAAGALTPSLGWACFALFVAHVVFLVIMVGLDIAGVYPKLNTPVMANDMTCVAQGKDSSVRPSS